MIGFTSQLQKQITHMERNTFFHGAKNINIRLHNNRVLDMCRRNIYYLLFSFVVFVLHISAS